MSFLFSPSLRRFIWVLYGDFGLCYAAEDPLASSFAEPGEDGSVAGSDKFVSICIVVESGVYV